ncbi:MAG: ATP-binding protein [Elusimicrobiota bacterium]
MLDKLYFIHKNTVKTAPLKFKRYLYAAVDWQARCICITGARGTGKTTLLLQYIQEHQPDVEECLYLSADNVEVSAAGLYNIAGEYFSYGGKTLVIDEIHKYPAWQVELKNIVDTFKDKQIIVSGSSSLSIKKGKADLSRRMAYYDLRGMSFREYLNLTKNTGFASVPLATILREHVKIAQGVLKQTQVLKHFNEYLQYGYYPFVTEGIGTYLQKVLGIIEKVFYEDIAVVGNLKRKNVVTIKKLLWIIATSTPFTVNIDKLSRETGVSKSYLYDYLEYLQDAGVLAGVYAEGKGYKLIRKPAKLFVENTNLLAALCGALRSESEQGTVRETFFVNQLGQQHKVSYSEKGDFAVDDKYTIEIGGKNKDGSQVANVNNAYIAADRIEIGHGKKVPLYLFGFLY